MDLLALYKKMSAFPGGKWLFTQLACWRAPYFASISPLITAFNANEITVRVKKHRAVENHIKTIHAIAICNACEMAAGFLLEAALPKHLRWIPKGMQVAYLKKTTGSIQATTTIANWAQVKPGDLNMVVTVLDSLNEKVVEATITMWISEKRK